jgi:hypothetical protein
MGIVARIALGLLAAALPLTTTEVDSQRMESLRLQRALIQAGENAHRAWIEHTTPEQRKAETDAMMDNFRAVDDEVRSKRALTKLLDRSESNNEK